MNNDVWFQANQLKLVYVTSNLPTAFGFSESGKSGMIGTSLNSNLIVIDHPALKVVAFYFQLHLWNGQGRSPGRTASKSHLNLLDR